MQLKLEHVTKKQGAQTWLFETNLALKEGAVTVLLGATQAGKTSLMRMMAGLDKPTTGRVVVDGCDVTAMSVRDRNVAMVYQQFINYPTLTVFDNIASPLKLRKQKNINENVERLAKKLHIEPFLQRLPTELSGGQQQRVALARALAKNAPLMLLDEPLVNLDYKLREELREELAQLFAQGDTTVVYATTEPSEALLLGGYTAVMHEGRILQYGKTQAVFHHPATLDVALAFSDPPMNLIQARIQEQVCSMVLAAQSKTEMVADDKPQAPYQFALTKVLPTQKVTLGVRSTSLRLNKRENDLIFNAEVTLAEISGSDTFVHVHTAVGDLVAQLTGVHFFQMGEVVRLYVSPADFYIFGSNRNLLQSPVLPHAKGVNHGAN